jgi:uncharacterized damage-inducible protein DinB
MSVHEHYAIQFAYHWRTTDHLLNLAAGVDRAVLERPSAYGGRSIRELFFHILATDAGWRGALKTGQRPAPLAGQDFPDLTSLESGLADEESAWDAFLASLDDGALEAEAVLRSGDRTMRVARWRVLQHLVLHGMQHHAELAQLLTAVDRSPGDLDFIFFS